jgi:hypothetical protein
MVIFGVVMLTVGCALGLAAGFIGGHGYAHKHLRYRDPQLHNGKWDVAAVLNGNVTWQRKDSKPMNKDHYQHEANVCQIMRGMAHVDTCVCGKRRHGVFGSWF